MLRAYIRSTPLRGKLTMFVLKLRYLVSDISYNVFFKYTLTCLVQALDVLVCETCGDVVRLYPHCTWFKYVVTLCYILNEMFEMFVSRI